MDEAALIDSARRGDLDAYNRLVLAYQDMVYNQAYRLMGSFESSGGRRPGCIHFCIPQPVLLPGRLFQSLVASHRHQCLLRRATPPKTTPYRTIGTAGL